MDYKRIAIITISTVVLLTPVVAQDPVFSQYYTHHLYYNPAYAGSGEQMQIHVSYQDLYPALEHAYRNYYFSWDTYVPVLHGGAGIMIYRDSQGEFLQFTKASVQYSYHLRATRELFVHAGFRAGLGHKAYSLSGMILPEQVDPVSGISGSYHEILSPESRFFFDMGIGFLFLYKDFRLSLSAEHLAEPEYNNLTVLKRRYSISAYYPVFELQGETFSFHLRSNVRFMVQSPDIAIMPVIQAGTDRLSTHLGLCYHHSAGIAGIPLGIGITTGPVQFLYTYTIGAGKTAFYGNPGISHEAGIRVRVQPVHKSSDRKAIIYPDL